MPINTGVSASILRPGIFQTLTFLRAAGSLITVPLGIALIGAKLTTGATATVNAVYDMSGLTVTDADALFGVSSELALLYRQATLCASFFGRGPRIFCVPIAESAGAANVQTITLVGSATADGNQIFSISGRIFIVGHFSGDSVTTMALRVSNAFKTRAAELPVLVTVAAGVITLTHATKGVNGLDVKVTCNQQLTGCVATVAAGTAGSGATDHQPALDALSPLRYDGIVFANHAAADITEILADIAVRWSATSSRWGYYHMGEPGTIGTGTALSAAANDKALSINSMEGCLNTAGEMAVNIAMLVWSRERINASYSGQKVPQYPPATPLIYTPAEVETAIAAGLTPFTAVIDSSGAVTQNLAKCERLVTTHTTLSGQPDNLLRDISVPRTATGLALQFLAQLAGPLGADSNPDGVPQDADTDARLKDLWASILRAEARANPPVVDPNFVEADIASTIIEHDKVTLGRTNMATFYHPVGSQEQLAVQHNVTVGA